MVVEPHDSYLVPIVVNTAISIHSIQAVMQAIVEVCTVLLILIANHAAVLLPLHVLLMSLPFQIHACAIGFLELANAVPLCS